MSSPNQPAVQTPSFRPTRELDSVHATMKSSATLLRKLSSANVQLATENDRMQVEVALAKRERDLFKVAVSYASAGTIKESSIPGWVEARLNEPVPVEVYRQALTNAAPASAFSQSLPKTSSAQRHADAVQTFAGFAVSPIGRS